MYKNQKLIRFAQSFIILPLITVSGSLGGTLPQAGSGIVSASQYVLSQKHNIVPNAQLALVEAAKLETKLRQIKASAIDAYFEDRNMPMAGLGMKMVIEAEKNDLDWRMLAAIAVRESTGGRHKCKKADFSAFGWGSCKIDFKSDEHAIEVVAKNLGGNNPKTAHHYDNKTTREILKAYNPPSIVPRYVDQVISIMNSIGPETINVPVTEDKA